MTASFGRTMEAISLCSCSPGGITIEKSKMPKVLRGYFGSWPLG